MAAPDKKLDKPSGALGLFKRFGPLILIVLILIAVIASGATHYLSLDALRENAARLKAYEAAHPVLSIGLFILIYLLCTAASVPGASLLTLAGGFIFGTWVGGTATVIGATIGAVIIFLAAKSAIGGALRERAQSSGGMLARLSEGVRNNAFSAILSLRLIPAAPFWLVNIAAGVADAPLGAYALATFLGVMPATFIYTGIGSGLERLFAAGKTPNLSVLYQPHVLLPLIGLALLSLAPMVVRRLRGAKAAA